MYPTIGVSLRVFSIAAIKNKHDLLNSYAILAAAHLLSVTLPNEWNSGDSKLPRPCIPCSHKHGSECCSRSVWLCPYIVNSDSTLRLSATSHTLLPMTWFNPHYCMSGSRAITVMSKLYQSDWLGIPLCLKYYCYYYIIVVFLKDNEELTFPDSSKILLTSWIKEYYVFQITTIYYSR